MGRPTASGERYEIFKSFRTKNELDEFIANSNKVWRYTKSESRKNCAVCRRRVLCSKHKMHLKEGYYADSRSKLDYQFSTRVKIEICKKDDELNNSDMFLLGNNTGESLIAHQDDNHQETLEERKFVDELAYEYDSKPNIINDLYEDKKYNNIHIDGKILIFMFYIIKHA